MVAESVSEYLAERRRLMARIEKVAAAIALHDEEQTRRLAQQVPGARELQAAAMARQALVTMRKRLVRDLDRLDGKQ
jgi:hypothetical protein